MGDLEATSRQIIEAADVLMQNSSSYEQRLQAYEFLEKIKNDAQVCLASGFVICKSENSQIKHLGLQLIEEALKYQWINLTIQSKIEIKENVMNLLKCGTEGTSELYIKDKISRLVVEMIKREWPQQWPELLSELAEISEIGPLQAELVLFIFKRLSEDVISFKNIACEKRRKDLNAGLNLNVEQIFVLFTKLFHVHFESYSKGENKAQHCKVLQAVLSSMTVYYEWVNQSYVIIHKDHIMPILNQLLFDDNLRQHAAENLLQIFERKCSAEEKKFILFEFTPLCLDNVLNAIKIASSETFNDKIYLLVKTLTQVIAECSSNLSSYLCEKETKISDLPFNFAMYLDVLLQFTDHPSLMIYSYTCPVWVSFFKCDEIKSAVEFYDFIDKWLVVAYSKILRHGSISSNDYSKFAVLDFDSSSDCYTFWCNVRSETIKCLKSAAVLKPEIVFEFLKGKMGRCLEFDVSGTQSDSQCVSLAMKEWEAVSFITEPILQSLDFSNSPNIIQNVKNLLEHCLMYNCSHSEIRSYILTVISGLCVVLPHAVDIRRKVLEVLFYGLKNEEWSNVKIDNGVSKEVKRLKKHSGALLLKLFKTYPEVFLPIFTEIRLGVEDVLQNSNCSSLIKNILLACLLTLNNLVPTYDQQYNFLKEILDPVIHDFSSLKEYAQSFASFMNSVGLLAAESQAEVEPFVSVRKKILSCVDFLDVVLLRCDPKSTNLDLKAGGFLVTSNGTNSGPVSLNGNSDTLDNCDLVCRNPASPFILQMLPQIFCLLRLLHDIHSSDAINLLPPHYSKVHNMTEPEKQGILGLSNSHVVSDKEVLKTPFILLQVFLNNAYSSLASILNRSIMVLGHDVYQFRNIGDCLSNSIFSNLNYLPNSKLRQVVKFFSSFILSCPSQFYETVALPLLSLIFPRFLETLDTRWEKLRMAQSSSDYDQDELDTEEIVQDMLLRALTNDYCDTLVKMIRFRRGKRDNLDKSFENGDNLGDNANDHVEMSEMYDKLSQNENKPSQDGNSFVFSDFGKILVACQPVCHPFLLTLLKSLSWPNSTSCKMSSQVIFPIVKESFNLEQKSSHKFLNADTINELFLCVMKGLNTNGHHLEDMQHLVDVCVPLYEFFVPIFPSLREYVLTLPGVDVQQLEQFEKEIVICQNSKKVKRFTKFKRNAFVKLMNGIIGKNVSETFKKEIKFAKLAPIQTQNRRRENSAAKENENLDLCSLFGV